MKPTLSFARTLPLLGLMLFSQGVLHAEPASKNLRDRQAAVLNVVNHSGKAVVGIAGIGSGVVVSKDGLILTAGHVMDAMESPPLRKDNGEFDIILADGREVKAKSLGRNRNRDAALAQITTPGEYVYAEMADEKSIHQGDWCVAMGHPGGYQVDRTAPVRTGRLWKKDDNAYYRTDCTVSGGDSGGPLFNLEGKVIGIHSSIGERLEENRHVPIGAYTGESFEKMKKSKVWGQLGSLMPELAPFDKGHGQGNLDDEDEDETPAPRKRNLELPKQAPAGNGGYLGILMGDTDNGVEVSEVMAGSPAEKAGVSAKSIISKIDGKAVSSISEVKELVGTHKPGDKLKVTLENNNKTSEVEVTLAKRGE